MDRSTPRKGLSGVTNLRLSSDVIAKLFTSKSPATTHQLALPDLVIPQRNSAPGKQ